ncbi:iron-sulfur cluster-binding domain-containing protein [Acinetobacter qingfengensis]|uniref:Oxidoreductase n=1 Tax=Acinetobacter qingfengensis TaxID=1262585 RepID=A0A1E7QXK4_9GAMM|nr:iron-sulfur cluster-binding domain-containing protein [Acinetobacter qingfengensis]KAA8731726.1 iron-sulfur cluster-binding domain-containing protein [Acinetobacter qingfengensis]OEY91818.1 oxidoreductase [Acinetobacter qingfengensis]
MQQLQRKSNLLEIAAESIYDRDMTNFWLQKINPLWSTHEVLGKIVNKKIIAHDMIALTVRCNRNMQYGLPGQHHPIKVEIEGRKYERTYSLTQLNANHVQINVKKVPQGIMSHWLCEQSHIGDIIELGTPYGDMTLSQLPQQLIMVAAGSGITPMYSMLYNLAQNGQLSNIQITLLYWAKQQQDFAFQTEFTQWQEQYTHFNVQYFCTQQTPFDSRINTEHRKKFNNIQQQDVYICGPSGFVNAATQVFSDAKQLCSEAFSLSPIPVDTEAGVIQITLSKSNQIVTIPKGQPILIGLEQANVKPTHGCRMGICNKCSCKKANGQTKNLNDGSINNEPNQDLRICVNTAQSDLILDL